MGTSDNIWVDMIIPEYINIYENLNEYKYIYIWVYVWEHLIISEYIWEEHIGECMRIPAYVVLVTSENIPGNIIDDMDMSEHITEYIR